uniref:Putative secreted protein n=1 Tax=Ixodes ricinus TaxID=34613 RepID=A0A6B0UAL3_IXORI
MGIQQHISIAYVVQGSLVFLLGSTVPFWSAAKPFRLIPLVQLTGSHHPTSCSDLLCRFQHVRKSSRHCTQSIFYLSPVYSLYRKIRP